MASRGARHTLVLRSLHAPARRLVGSPVRRALLVAVLVGVGCSVAASAWAAPSARLEYVRGRGAESCPEEAAVRAGVVAGLGYDPFREPADGAIVLRVEVRRVGRSMRARIATAGGGARELRAAGGRCDELANALELA